MMNVQTSTGWKSKRIGDCCDVVSGGTPKRNRSEYWNGGIPWVTPKDISRLSDPIFMEPPETISELGLAQSSATLLPEGAILLSSRAPIGLVAIAGKPMATNQGFKSLVPGPELDSRFLYHAIKRMVPEIALKGNGATFKEVSKSVVSDIELNFPKDIDEQRRIAAILDKADVIRRKREQALALADDFLRSVFLDMFGDPVMNPKGWPEKKLIDVCSKITDGTHDTPRRQNSGVPFITGKNVRPFKINLDNLDFVSEEVHREIFRRCDPEYGDVLYTNIGVNTGTAAYNQFEYEFSMKNVALLKPKMEQSTGRYLEFLLNHEGFKQRTLAKNGLGGAQGFLGLKSIKNIMIPAPDYDLQKDFSKFVDNAGQANLKATNALEEAADLFSSLSQRAFRGEL